jgi:hypothetical protein
MRTSAICHEPLLHQLPLPPPRAPPQATPPCAPRQASRFLASASAIIATALAAIAAAVVCASQQPTIKLRLWRHVQASVASESYGELRDVKLIPSMDLPSIILTFSHTTESAHSTDQHLFIITCMHSSCACFFTIGSSSCGSIEHQLGWMHICFWLCFLHDTFAARCISMAYSFQPLGYIRRPVVCSPRMIFTLLPAGASGTPVGSGITVSPRSTLRGGVESYSQSRVLFMDKLAL